MKTNLSYLTKSNGLNCSTSNSNFLDKKDFLKKLKDHSHNGVIIAHLVNFKMYCTVNNIASQSIELEKIRELVEENYHDSNITFDDTQKFVRNRNVLFQRQLPHHFKQAIIDLLDGKDIKQQQGFWNSLASDSHRFLEKNGIDIPAFIKIQRSNGINPNGSFSDPLKALEVLEKFGGQFEDSVRHSLVRALIENFSGTDFYDYFHNPQKPLGTLKKIADQLDNLDKVRNPSKALELLEKFGDQLDDKVRHSLIITLIKNCSSINLSGNVSDLRNALEALEKFGNQLGDNLHHPLVITLIKNCSSTN
ncbi:MAG: hypothetical protein ACK4M7_07605, partial [Burkholderiales bacterium]